MKNSLWKIVVAVSLLTAIAALMNGARNRVATNQKLKSVPAGLREAKTAAFDVKCRDAIGCPKTLAPRRSSHEAKPALFAEPSESNAPEQSRSRIFSDFDRWTEEYLSAAYADGKTTLETHGEALAQARRRELAQLIESDPERAIRNAVPIAVRQQLPSSITRHMEERVSARANYEVIATLDTPDDPALKASIHRRVTIEGRVLRAFVYGWRLQQPTKEDIALHGIAIDDVLAVHENPVRVLEAGEAPRAASMPGTDNEFCPVSGQKAPSTGVAVEVGGESFSLCRAGHIAALSQTLEQQQRMPGPKSGSWVAGNRTHGPKRLLFMRVIFPDSQATPISETAAHELVREANDFFIQNSYGATTLSATVTPLLTMPRPGSWYATRWYPPNYADATLLFDARQAAAAAGYDTAGYDLDLVSSQLGGVQSQAFVGGKGVWLQSPDRFTLCHELGHNFGLSHANAWKASDHSVTGAGQNLEYGNVYDAMGRRDAALYQFNACHKHRLGWLPDSAVQTVSTDGVYRLHPFDTEKLANGLPYALRIRKDDERDYWIETRLQLTARAGSRPSILIYWSPWSQSSGGSQLLDTTPGSEGGTFDAPLLAGQTFSDPELGLTITLREPDESASGSVMVQIELKANQVATPSVASQPRLHIQRAANGRATLFVTGETGRRYVIEASADLANWEVVTTMTNTGITTAIEEIDTTRLPRRFFRALAE